MHPLFSVIIQTVVQASNHNAHHLDIVDFADVDHMTKYSNFQSQSGAVGEEVVTVNNIEDEENQKTTRTFKVSAEILIIKQKLRELKISLKDHKCDNIMNCELLRNNPDVRHNKTVAKSEFTRLNNEINNHLLLYNNSSILFEKIISNLIKTASDDKEGLNLKQTSIFLEHEKFINKVHEECKQAMSTFRQITIFLNDETINAHFTKEELVKLLKNEKILYDGYQTLLNRILQMLTMHFNLASKYTYGTMNIIIEKALNAHGDISMEYEKFVKDFQRFK